MAAGARRRRREASRSEQFQLRFGFHVEEANAGAQRFANLLARLAHAGKDDAVAGNAGALQAVEFAAGNNVEAAAQTCQQAQDGKIRIGLHRVADRVRQASEGAIQHAIRAGDAGGAVDVGGSAHAVGDLLQGDAFAVELPVSPGKSAGVASGIGRRGRHATGFCELRERFGGSRTFITTSVRSS